jgi:transposase
MQEVLAELKKQNAEQAAQNRLLLERIDQLLSENRLLNQKVQVLMKRLFGRKSEKLDKRQLDLLLGELAALDKNKDDDPPPSPPRPRKKRRASKPRLPEDLPTEDILIDPDEVKADPESYKRIGEEVTEELDVIPPKYICRRFIRGKYVCKDDRSQPPLIAALPPRLIEGSYASAGLLTDIVLKKYADHLPLYRQERILRERFGIDLARTTMSDWVWATANWLKPIYRHLREDLRATGYLQVDETPVRYCQAEEGGSGQGYFWVYHHPATAGKPGGDVLYEWHTTRAAACLDEMLEGFEGTVQCDGYSAYTKYAREHEGVDLAGCWAHARRKFHEALEEAPDLARWFLNQIGLLYRIERDLRSAHTPPVLREVIRSAESRMILERLGKVLKIKMPDHLPRSQMGKAIAYSLAHWDQLLRYAGDGRLEIDNNLVENAVRPTAVGKKNWLFIGHPEAGERSAVIYTILESCKRHAINPEEYLRDVLNRLPSMTNQQTRILTPANWLAAQRQTAA